MYCCKRVRAAVQNSIGNVARSKGLVQFSTTHQIESTPLGFRKQLSFSSKSPLSAVEYAVVVLGNISPPTTKKGLRMRVPHLLALSILFVLPNDRMIGFASYFHSKKLTIEVTELAVSKTPSWVENSENPPLSARQAIQNATKVKDKIVKDTNEEKWVLKSAELCPFFHGEKWYWRVNFEGELLHGGIMGVPSQISLAVLMDGTVVTPEVTERLKAEE